MIRRGRWIVLVVVALLVAVVLAGVLLVRPDLVETRDRVDARWDALRSDLAERYEQLAAVTTALDGAGANERSVTRDLREELDRWSELRGRKQIDREGEATSANNLEALARRATENFNNSDRLQNNADLVAAFQVFDLTIVSQPAVAAYNRAVRKYEATRDGAFARLIAGALGFEARPVLFQA
jgi:hypothetical protein